MSTLAHKIQIKINIKKNYYKHYSHELTHTQRPATPISAFKKTHTHAISRALTLDTRGPFTRNWLANWTVTVHIHSRECMDTQLLCLGQIWLRTFPGLNYIHKHTHIAQSTNHFTMGHNLTYWITTSSSCVFVGGRADDLITLGNARVDLIKSEIDDDRR